MPSRSKTAPKSIHVSPVPDDIIPRAAAAFLENAQSAAGQGLSGEESVWLQAALMLRPQWKEATLQLIDTRIRRGEHAQAIELAAALVEREPQDPRALWHLGYALQLTGRHVDSMPYYARAYAIDKSVPTLLNNFAVAMEMDGRESEALSMLEEAVALNANDLEAWTNLTRIYTKRMELEHALAAGRRAVQIAPAYALGQSNYSLALKEAQRWQEATQAAAVATDAAPGFARFPFNLSILDLVQRNYARGWDGFEARWEGSDELSGTSPNFPVPRWNGESLRGKTLLLWGEQGFGDALQFSRFVPMLAKQVQAHGGKLVWAAFSALHPLMARSAPKGVECITHDTVLPPFHFHFPLLSLPRHFEIDESSIPARRGYLSADPELVERWSAQIADKRLRVGLVWSGSLSHQRNAFRRVGIERLAKALGTVEEVAFFSLQKDADADISAAQSNGLRITDHTSEFASFDDTAGFIESLDLVITVCTSVAHLAGALGKPTWVLLDVNPHWVWQLDRADSPWYPSATLYRQKHFAQWEPVLEEVAHDLAALAARHARSPAPKRRVGKKTAEQGV
jgi:tetratricopeptide (TPR) repeat protein